MRMSGISRAVGLLVILAVGGAPAASEASTTFARASLTDFSVPLQGKYWSERGIVAGPDGAMWFCAESLDGQDAYYKSAIVRVALNGTFRIFSLPKNAAPRTIVVGADRALWFTEYGDNKIGRLTTSGVLTEFPLPSSLSGPVSIVSAPDGTLWFSISLVGNIGRITTKGVVTAIPCQKSCAPTDLAVGADGAIWSTDELTVGLDRFTLSGNATFVSLGSRVHNTLSGIVTGPDGALWICDDVGGGIVRYPIGGRATEESVPLPYAAPASIAVGADGALWFTSFEGALGTPTIGRIDVAGQFAFYPLPTRPLAGPGAIAPGPRKTLWVTDFLEKKIWRLTLP